MPTHPRTGDSLGQSLDQSAFTSLGKGLPSGATKNGLASLVVLGADWEHGDAFRTDGAEVASVETCECARFNVVVNTVEI